MLSFVLSKGDILRAYSVFLMQPHVLLAYAVCAMGEAYNLQLKEILKIKPSES